MVGRNIPVFILDVDETIIGDIRPQLTEYYIINELHIKKDHPQQYNLYKKNLDYDLKGPIIRPFFKDFVHYCKIHKIPLFIYSASTPEWLSFIINLIEKYIDYKFERPLFSRKDMIKNPYVIKSEKHYDLVKSVDNIKPRIYKSLKKKRISDLVPLKDFKNIIMFDNRVDNIIFGKNLVLSCPDYNYTKIIDPLRILTEEQKYKYASKISKIIFNQVLDYESLIIHNYTKYTQEFKLFIIHNSKYKDDQFWKNVIDAIEKNTNITLSKLDNSAIFNKLHKRLYNSRHGSLIK